MDNYAFRVEIDDHPGALGRVASAIGALDGNITAVDVQELDGSAVVDELVLAVPAGVTPEIIRRAMLDAGARSVVSCTAPQRRVDAHVRCFDAARALLAAGDDEATLTGILCDVAMADEATLVPPEAARRSESAARALAERLPVTARVDWGWVLAVPHPEGDPDRVALLVRRTPMRFSATEVARVRAALRVATELQALRDGLRPR